uniref:Uncharacterized protein n=1 Tax=Panagrolaimus sp. PS1159 TaxID=55785 RepID=A0AC35FU04_9BILA
MIHAGHHQRPIMGKLQRSFSQVRPQQKKPSSQNRGGISSSAGPSKSTAPTATPSHSSSANHDSSPSSNELTFVVMGGEKVGKSALVSQFLWDKFIEEYHPTVEEFNWIEYDVGGSELMLQVIDTAGSHDFLAMRSLYARTGDAFFVVFAVDDPNSFLEAKKIIQEIREENRRNASILLIANKIDKINLMEGFDQTEFEEFAAKENIGYVTVSAKESLKVNKLFGDFLNKLKINRIPTATEYQLRKRRQSMPSRRACSGGIDIDVTDLERIAKRHSRRENCCIT